MATKTGYVDFTAHQYGGDIQVFRVHWQEDVSLTPNASSSVSITNLQLASSSYIGDTYYGDLKLEINGTEVITLGQTDGNWVYLSSFYNESNPNNNIYNVTRGGNKITSQPVTIAHNADGTKSVSITLKKNGIDYAGFYRTGAHFSFTTSSVSKTIQLTTIPVGSLSVDAGANSTVTVNRTSSTHSTTGTISSGAALYNGDILKISFTPAQNYAITTRTVNGNTFTSGDSLTISTSVKNATVVARASALSSSVAATNADIGSTSTPALITVTKYNTGYVHSLQYSFGSSSPVTGYITSTGGTSTTESKFSGTSISWTIPTTFYAKIPNAKSGTCTITCRTYSSTTSTTVLGTPTTATIIATAAAADAAPTVSGTVTDQNSATIKLTGNANKLVRYRSNAKCDITATARQNATISSKSINDTVVTGNTITYTGVNATSFKFSATDSRGYTTTVTVTPEMVNYVPVTINPAITRPSPTGSDLNLKFSGNYFNSSFGAKSNTLTVQYRYKLASASAYPSTWTTVSSSNYTVSTGSYSTATAGITLSNFPYNNDYDFQVRAYDGNVVDGSTVTLTTDTKTVSVASGLPSFEWGKDDFNFNTSTVRIGPGKKVRLFEDGEGGNIRIYPPDSVSGTVEYWECDAINGTLRFYARAKPAGASAFANYFALYLNPDGTVQIPHGLPIGSGGTGGTNRADAMYGLAFLGNNPIASTANDTQAAWKALGTGYAFFSATGRLTDQPNQYGLVLNIVNDNDVAQLWFTQPNGAVYRRGANANGWSGSWRLIFDSANTVPVSSGGTGSTNGATGLKNLFAAGSTVLSSYQYGTTLPAAGTAGRIFFLKA